MKLAAVSTIYNTGKCSPKGVQIWQATVRKNSKNKDTTCTGSESEVRSWVNQNLK